MSQFSPGSSPESSTIHSSFRILRDRMRETVDNAHPVRLRFIGMALVALIVFVVWLLGGGPDATDEAGSSSASIAALPKATTTTVMANQQSSASGQFVVQVAGAVRQPGVYHLAPGSRIGDALSVGGGPTVEADLDRLNLAAKIADGQRVYVLRQGESAPPPVAGSSGDPTGGTGDASTSSTQGTTIVDLNAATAAELDTLPGVGPATAAAILEYRNKSGPFKSVEDLTKVPGIGPAKLDRLRAQVQVSS